MLKKLVIIPTYNELENIAESINRVNAQAIADLDILVVDDNSPDGTAQAVERLRAINKNLYLLERSGKKGLGSAYLEGFKWALENNYALVIQMDADLSHDAADLPKMIAAARDRDFVIGSRYIGGGGIVGWTSFRKNLSAFGNLYARTILRVNIKDLTGGFNAWRSEIFSKIDLGQVTSTGYSFMAELKYRAATKGFSFAEVPIIFRDRRAGRSKMSLAIIWEAIWRTIKLKLTV